MASTRRHAQTDALSGKISTLKPLSGDVRAQQIRDVVDAFRRLRSSVTRFVQMFAAARDAALAADDLSAASLRELLSMLASEAQAARFARLRELKIAIRQARVLERTRDAVFSESFSTDPNAMRETVTALERVDAILVGLCVEHVLERHKPAPPRTVTLKPAPLPARRRQPEPVH
ncbi:hypothetical protein [Burkholderia sp. Ac-20365]|uniref:hypothetical protein n=1 Tax=Burkholderia sp. Ac-20365 TaxID=2703897 RepID=UPI00197B70DF|nr:hypothetical protein [Burkholderia sp. Ac-20365]MBN3763834.1 hypothetical protein [Burkholderia sp. Ac-20365]